MAVDPDVADAIARARAAEDLQAQGQDQVGLTVPGGTVFDTTTNEILPPADTFDPNNESVHTPVSMASRDMADTSSRGVSGSWDGRPGAQPSPLPAPSAPFSDNVAGGAQWASLASPDFQAPPPRAELVRMPPTGPVSMASRDITPQFAPRAALVSLPAQRAEMVEPDPTAAYLESLSPEQLDRISSNQADLNEAIRRTGGQGVAARAQMIEPDPTMAWLESLSPEQLDQVGAQKTWTYGAPPSTGVRPSATAGGAPAAGAPAAQKKSLVPPVPPVTTAPSTSPSAVSGPSPSSLTFDPNIQSVTARALPAGAVPPIKEPLQEPVTFTNPNGTSSPARVLAPNGQEPAAIIFHHTSGGGNPDGVRSTLAERHLGVQYIVDRDGNLVQGGGDGKSQIQKGWGKVGTGLENNNTVGVEFIAKDNNDITPAQLETAKKIGAMYPNANIFGHGEVNPGHKEADEGASTKAAALAYRSSSQVATPAEVNVTHFGYRGDPSLDSDSAAGRGKYVENMVPGYDVALNAAGAAKVGNPEPGKQFTYAGRAWRYGDQVPEKYQDARFDIFDPNNQFSGGLPQGAAQAGAQPQPQRQFTGQGFELVPAKPEELTAAQQADQANQQKQWGVLQGLVSQDKTPAEMVNILSKPIDGVNDAMRRHYLDQYKTEVTKEAQQFFGIKNPAQAYQKAVSSPDFGTLAGEIVRKIGPYMNQAVTGFNQTAAQIDQQRLVDFAKVLHPEATPEQQRAFIDSITSIQDEPQRAITINKLIGDFAAQNPQNPALSTLNAVNLADSASRLADPKYQAAQKAEITRQVNANMQALKGDPRIKGTAAWWVDLLAQQPKNVVEALSGPIGLNLMQGEIYQGTVDKLKAENPNMSEDQLRTKAGVSTMVQLGGADVLNHLMLGGAGEAAAGIQNPAKRIAASALVHAASGGSVGTAQQLGANIVEGRPLFEGVGQAALAGAVQTAPGGVIAGLRGVPRGIIAEPAPERAAPVTEERPPVQPPIEERPPPVEERPPVAEERPPIQEEPLPEKPVPVEERPQEEVEADLNRQTEELDKRYDAEQKLAPVEEPPVSADIREGEQRPSELPADIREPGGERMVPGVDVRPEVGGPGRAEEGRGPDVSQQLGRVPRPLEVPVSPEERAAYQPLVEALERAPVGTNDSKEAYRALFDKIYQKFEPLFKAAGANHLEKSTAQYKGIAGVAFDHQGNLELWTNHDQFERAVRIVIERGNDPVDYIHQVFQEELLHAGENLVRRDQWRNELKTGKTTENFVDYKSRRARQLIDNLLGSADRQREKGNVVGADEIENALADSVRAYGIEPGKGGFKIGRQEALGHLEDLRGKAASASDPDRYASQMKLGNVAAELTRQMLQLKHGDWTERSWRHAWQLAADWYKAAVEGLKRLYGRLGPGQDLAKTELAKLVRATERKLAIIEARAAKALSEPGRSLTGTARFPEHEITTETARDWLAERLRKAKAAYGLAFKSGESSMLDYEETRNLARAIRRKPSLIQAYGQRARLNELADAFNSVPRNQRDRVKTEFAAYTRAEQMKQPLPAIGVDTMRLINAGKNTLEGFGQIAKELNVHVKDSEGRIRPMRLIGRDYYPRMISADMRDIFNERDGARKADFDALVQRQIARGVVKDRQEFIDKFTHAINGEPHSNDQFSNLERAREAQLPLDFYDFSPEALLRYSGRAADRLAQVGSFGQKLSEKGKDIFDRAIEKVNQSGNLSYSAKEALVNRIAGERKAQYSAGPVSGLERSGSFLRNVASGLYLSNWQTAFRNLVTGAAQNMVFGGPSSFIKTAAQFPFGWRKIIAEARDRNLFRANLRNILDDYDLATNPNWWERSGRGMADAALKYGGHNLTEAINRSFAMQQGKQILRDFARDYGVNDNAVSRARNEFVARRFGFRHDEDASRTLTALAREGGVGPLTDEFLRQHVMDVHANYGPGQSPAHLLNNPAGKMLFQFQRWGANAARMMTRDYIMPWTRAMQSGSLADKGYHSLRMLGFLAAGTGVGGAFQAAINAVYHRDPKDPTLAEIGKAVSQGDYKTAFSYGIQKAYGLMLLSGFSGLFGDYAGMIQEHMGKDPGGRFKDPLHPPGFSIAEPFMALFQGWKGEGGAVPSPKLMDEFLQKLSSTYRVSKQAALGLATSAGIKMPLSQEYQAENDRNFTRQRIAMFEAQNPALQQKAEAQGTQAAIISMTGRKPFSPVRDKIVGGLLSGNPEEVNGAIRDWLTKTPIEARAAEYKKIKQNINSNSPLKVGGSTKPEATTEFLAWAKDNLPEGEARRIFALASTYAKTALSTGLEDSSKPMQQMARLDYDKFRTPKSGPAQAAAKAKATAQGRVVMQQLIARQRAAQALQGR